MTDRQEIIRMLRDGQSIRHIAKAMDCDRKTVRRYRDEYEQALASEDSGGAVLELIHTGPVYHVANRGYRRFSDEMRDRVDHYIEVNRKLRHNGMKKQCLTGKEIHRKLVAEGYDISYPTVSNYLHKKSLEKSGEAVGHECFLRIHYEPGQIVEFDWGEVTLYIKDKPVRFYMAVFTFAYSDARYTYLFRHQDQLAFMESHRNFFRDIDGVPVCMVYDNMRVAVKEFVGTERKITEALASMVSFYGFGYRFCNIRSGNEKGHVENSVKVVRRRGLSGEDIYFDSIEQAQKHVDGICSELNMESKNKSNRLLEDMSALRPRKGDFGCFLLLDRKVDKWGTVSVNNVHYSVPDHLVGKEVTVRQYSEKVTVYYNKERMAVHQRCYSNEEQWVMDLEHYLPTLMCKPNSLTHTQAWYNANDSLKRVYSNRFSGSNKEFIQLMVVMKENGYTVAELESKAKELYGRGVRKATKDQLVAMLQNSSMEVEERKADNSFNVQELLIEKSTGAALESITAIMGQQSVMYRANNVI